MSQKNSLNGTWMLIIIVAVVLLLTAFYVVGNIQRDNKKKECEKSNQVYIESSNTCRNKTVSEKFNEQCTGGITIGDTKYTCDEIKKANLEEAYLNNEIIKHGETIYEKGTYSEVQAGKEVGDYCLSASDTWFHIGETRCVVFTPARLANQGNNYFLDEKEDYINGFVVYMYGNYGWNWFLDTYIDKGPILVCGVISTYQGHPQIKTNPSGTLISPKATADGMYTVYRYACN